MPSRQVPIRTKLIYSAGEITVSAKNAALNQFLLFFYTDVVHLGPGLVSAAIFVGRLWDACIDPAMGYVSDTTNSRWGRRRPFVALSSLPVGLGFYFLFAPPLWESWATFFYLTGAYLVLMTAFTVFATPYLAWGAELVQDYHERTEVVQIRSLFGVVGGVLGATLPIMIARQYDDQRVGFA
ncbi:MAG TPA: MFS transporter, partial [Candidatus Acidoferrales bacterium]|nr:MFS transporter [Candidatus Acidoferrales bacterium]